MTSMVLDWFQACLGAEVEVEVERAAKCRSASMEAMVTFCLTAAAGVGAGAGAGAGAGVGREAFLPRALCIQETAGFLVRGGARERVRSSTILGPEKRCVMSTVSVVGVEVGAGAGAGRGVGRGVSSSSESDSARASKAPPVMRLGAGWC